MSRLPVLFTAHGNPMNALGTTPFAARLRALGHRVAGARGDPLRLGPPRGDAALAHVGRAARGRSTTSTASRRRSTRCATPRPAPPTSPDGPRRSWPRRASRFASTPTPASTTARGRRSSSPAPPPTFPSPSSRCPPDRGSTSARRWGAPSRRFATKGSSSSGAATSSTTSARPTSREVDLPVPAWAAEFDDWVGGRIAAGDVDALAALAGAPSPRRAHPTLEHYAPVVACAAAAGGDTAAFPITGFEHASLSFRCVRWG